MNIPIAKGSRVAERQGGLKHTVLEIGSDGICTWSDPVPEDLGMKGVGGFSWFGPYAEFLKFFICL